MKHMRWNARADGNQREIVRALEAIGCDVCPIKGETGLPDLLVGYRNENFLLEVKNRDGHNRLSGQQAEWHRAWRGRTPSVVRSPEEAIEAVTNG